MRLREPLDWLPEFRASLLETALGATLALRVYRKCGDAAELPWEPDERIQLPNRGEECLGYLSYMARYAALPDSSVFFQGEGVLDGWTDLPGQGACVWHSRRAGREERLPHCKWPHLHRHLSVAQGVRRRPVARRVASATKSPRPCCCSHCAAHHYHGVL